MFYTYEELEQPVKYGVEIDKFEDMDEALYYLQFGLEATLDFAEEYMSDIVMIDMTGDEPTDEEEWLYTDKASLLRGEWALISIDEVKWNINDTIKERYTLDELKALLSVL